MSMLFGGGNKPKSTVADKLGSIRIQSQGYANVITLVWGKGRVAATLIFYSNFVATPHVENVKSGGKGGKKKKATNTTWSYSAAIMLGLAGHEIQATGKLWVDKKLYANVAATGLSVFTGGNTQAAWGYLTTYEPTKAVALRGFAYLAANNYQLSDTASLGNHSVEVLGKFCTGANDDANPADIVRSILVDYCGIDTAKVTDLATYRAACTANDLLFSYVLDSQVAAGEVIAELLKYTASELVRRNGVFDIVGYDQAGIDTGLSLTYDDFVAETGTMPVTPTRSKAVDAFNSLKLEFIDRANDYNIKIVEAKDSASIETIGLRAAETTKAHCISRESVANNVVNHLLYKSIGVRNTYEFTLNLRYIRLEAMDVVTITDVNLGLINAPVIIKKIVITSDYSLKITAEDYAGQIYRATNYATSGGGANASNTNVAVGNINPPVIFKAPEILTATGYELWCAISSNDVNHGGCSVYISIDGGASYNFVAGHDGETRSGVLTANLASASGLDTTNTLAVDLTVSSGDLSTVSQDSFDTHATLCRAGAEFLTYRDVTLTAPNTFAIAHLQRGLYGSTTGASTADKFIRCDDSLFKYAYPASFLGKTIYLKFPAYNNYGNTEQDLSSVTAYSFAIPSTVAITNTSAATPASQAALITAAPVTTTPATTDTIAIVDNTTGELKQVAISTISGGGSNPYGFIEVARETTGTAPLLVTEFTLPARTYTAFTAVIGTALSTTIATLDIKKQDGTVLKTLTCTGTPLQVSTTGFTLATDTLCGFYLRGDLSTTQSYVFSVGLK